jgi:hypothetical protein
MTAYRLFLDVIIVGRPRANDTVLRFLGPGTEDEGVAVAVAAVVVVSCIDSAEISFLLLFAQEASINLHCVDREERN